MTIIIGLTLIIKKKKKEEEFNECFYSVNKSLHLKTIFLKKINIS
jgi:hypothetical protein